MFGGRVSVPMQHACRRHAGSSPVGGGACGTLTELVAAAAAAAVDPPLAGPLGGLGATLLACMCPSQPLLLYRRYVDSS